MAKIQWRLAYLFEKDSVRSHLIRGVLGTGGLRAANAILAISIAMVLARTLGADGYGTYSFALALVILLTIPAQMGLPTLTVRESAKYHAQRCWGKLRGLLIKTNQATLILSATVVVLAIATALALAERVSHEKLETFFWALPLVPLVALGTLRSAALRGLGYVVQGQVPEQFLRPTLFLMLIAGVAAASQLTPQIAMALYIAAATAAFVVGAVLLVRAAPAEMREAIAEYETRLWKRSAISLSLVAGIQVFNEQVSVAILGLFASSKEVGIYRIATQGAVLLALPVAVVNIALGPSISRLYVAGEQERLQKVAAWSARFASALVFPIAAIFILLGNKVLSFAFGEEFSAGHVSLAVLACGQLTSALLGSAGLLLNMTGQEQETAKAFAIAGVTSLVLNAVLIPMLGLVGAAMAVSATQVTLSVILYRRVRKRIGINSAVADFSSLFKRY